MASTDLTPGGKAVSPLTVTRPADQPLERADAPPEQILEGDPVWEQTAVWTSPDGSKMAGAFRSTPGRFKWHQRFHETT